MSYPLSDSDSTDSESGIRFKTESTRNKTGNPSSLNKRSPVRERHRSSDRYRDINRSSNQSHSGRRHHDQSRNRSYSRDSRRRSNSRETRRHHRTDSKRQSTDKSSSRNSTDEYKSKEKCNKSESRKSEDSKSEEYNPKHNLKNIIVTNNLNNERKVVNCIHLKRHNSEDRSEANSISNNKNLNSKAKKDFKKYHLNDGDDVLSSKINVSTPDLSPVLKKPEENFTQSFGPALPPKNNKNSNTDKLLQEKPSNFDKNNINEQSLSSKLKKFEQNSESISITTSDESGSEDEIIGPALPTILTTKSQNLELETNGKIKNDNSSLFGPALPPHLQKSTTDTLKKNDNETSEKIKVIGPTLPPHLREMLQNVEVQNLDPDTSSHQLSDSDDDMIGPLPEGHAASNPSYTLLEERALQMRLDRLGPSAPETTVREEWMLELPKVQTAHLGLGPRQFRAKPGPDMSDRSSWTDTPEDKAKRSAKISVPKKVDMKKEAEQEHIRQRDLEQAKIVDKHKKKKKRDKALIDMHQEKLKKKKKKEDEAGKSERRPFDRDIDLKTSRFDDAQKKAILKKAQLLDTRFSTGEAKFL